MTLIRSAEAYEEYKNTAGFVQLRPETKAKLSELRRDKDSTFDDIIVRLIKHAKKHGLDVD